MRIARPVFLCLVAASVAASSPSFGKFHTFPAVGATLGAIPDSDSVVACQGNSTTSLDVEFDATGLSGTVLEVRVDFNASHTWLQDLEVMLFAPGGARNHLLFSATGTTSTTPNNCGDATWGAQSDLSSANKIYFDDSANSNRWDNAKIATTVPSAASRTVVSGIGGITNPPPATTSMFAAFRGLTAAQANGTWILRFRDRGAGITGSVAGANLKILTTGFDADAGTLGAIPDSDVTSPLCQNDSTTYRDVQFPVSGQLGVIQSVAVDFSAFHDYLQDLEVTLISPGAVRSHLLFSATGTTTNTVNSCAGSTSDLSTSNTYLFADSAAANWWTTAGNNIVVPTSTNRTVVTGIGGTSNPPATTSLDATFAGLRRSEVNGIWTMRFRDRGRFSTGSVSAAHLSLTMSIFADDFEQNGSCNWSDTPEVCD